MNGKPGLLLGSVLCRLLTAALLGASAAALACGGGDSLTGPTTGILEVTTSTTGIETDSDGYSVQVDGGPAEAIGSTATLRRTDATGGPHTVLLGGIADNCTVEGANPRSTTIIAGQTSTVTFAITCRATTGSLQISSETSGPSPDQDGYAVALDGTNSGALAPAGVITLEELAPGAHVVGLSDISGNCQVAGDNPRTVTITAGATAIAAFNIVCVDPPPTTGTLRVVARTSGPGSDPDGYAFTVDGSGTQPIGVNDVAAVPSLEVGVHSVLLSDVADHCTLTGFNPRSVTVPSGGTAEVVFSLSCQPLMGDIEVTTSTSGSDLDANGYAFTIDDGSSQPIAVNATVTAPALAPGPHVVRLSDIAGNCGVQGTNPRTASVVGGEVAKVAFTIVCTAPPSGSIAIAITTNPPTSALEREVFDPRVQPELVVKDGSGGPVGGVEVTASLVSGNGTLEGKTTATTNASGVAKFGDLGIRGTGDHVLEFTAATATVRSSPVDVSPLPQAATRGEWGPVVNWGTVVPLHISLLPTGKILAWGRNETDGVTMGMPRIWDPAAGLPTTATTIHVDTMLFCAGHTLMADGRLMVAGGHKADGTGINVTNFFSADGAWQKGPNMAHGRWYPTLTVLPDRRVLSMAGSDEAAQVVKIPEIWENGRWVQLPGASAVEIPYYPRNFVAPNGLIFYASERIMSRWFDVDGSGAGGRGRWSNGPSHIWPFNREYGSAVMYETGKILVVGGGGHTGWRQSPDVKSSAPTATAEKIDLTQSNPQWQNVSPMAAPRRHMNATVLPDGQVLVTGGTRGAGFVNISTSLAVKEAELWNPGTGQWTTLAANSRMRIYHSVSLLLPNGTVLHGASGDAMAGTVPVPAERNHEIFSPPYLFKGARPTITSAPASVGYNQTFSVATPNTAQITAVRWIRLGSVTHAFDASARANSLTFTISGGNVEVTGPANANLAPPGHYLLFILNRNGVPSTGKVVRVQ